MLIVDKMNYNIGVYKLYYVIELFLVANDTINLLH